MAVCALILLSPMLVMIAFVVWMELGYPILFLQERVGKSEKIFTLYKFRTMTNEHDVMGALLSDEIRLTKFGQILRSTSLDELPELFNIIKGDMSVVGPRPLLVSYLPYYDVEQRLRHSVRPGLTGYAQVHGRNTVDWDEKFRMDLNYVKNISFWMDLKIIFTTVKTVFKREGIHSETSATMESFIYYCEKRKRTKNRR